MSGARGARAPPKRHVGVVVSFVTANAPMAERQTWIGIAWDQPINPRHVQILNAMVSYCEQFSIMYCNIM